MNVTREVIVDLLPIYFSGEASPDTRTLVESFLKDDLELAQTIRGRWVENMARAVPSSLPPELELRALRRTRRALGRLRWVMGFAMFFTALLASIRFTVRGANVYDLHFLARDYPVFFAVSAALAAACWTAYFLLRRGLQARV